MASSRHTVRRRIGRVSLYKHHGGHWEYHREGGRTIRRLVGDNAALAECEASLINARLVAIAAGLDLRAVPAAADLGWLVGTATGTTSRDESSTVGVEELRSRFLAHHDKVLGSSLATVNRYRSATLYLESFASGKRIENPLRVPVTAFVEHLRGLEISPNGHANSAKRRLRDKGIRYILECCRSMYRFGQSQGLLPKDLPSPFSEVAAGRLKIRDAKPIVVFTAEQELAFLRAARGWECPVQFTLAKTGARRGELVHMLIEDLEPGPTGGWWHLCGKPELGWTTKTSGDRHIPLGRELLALLMHVIGDRKHGPVFLRPKISGDRLKLTGNRAALAQAAERRLAEERACLGRPLTRKEHAKVHASVWRDAGAVDPDSVRTSFIRIAKSAGIAGATCVKTWRHTFATVLQQANVDPLVRQEVLGHKPSSPEGAALGMTSLYTHSTPEFVQKEIKRALRLRPRSLELVQDFISKAKESLS